MNWLSSLLKSRAGTIQDAERITIGLLGTGLLAIVAGFIVKLMSPFVGTTILILGGIALALTVAWAVFASKLSTLAKNCPRCGKPNRMFSEEKYFRCVSCGYFAVLRDV